MAIKYFKFAVIVLLGVVAACSGDAPATPLPQPVTGTETASVSSLTFEWEAVEGAIQYGLQLAGPEGAVIDTRVTGACRATFTSLEPDTEYTLSIWAYGAMGSNNGTSPVLVLKAATAPLTVLATPCPLISTDGAVVTASWEAVEGAQYYAYEFYTPDHLRTVASGTTEGTSVSFGIGAPGDYEFSVYAASDDEAYVQSATGTMAFSITRYEIWRVEGSYYSAYFKSSWPATMVAYSDGAYSILAWYEHEGYDLLFAVAQNGELQILNPDAWINEWGYTCVPTGIDGYDLPLWLADGFSAFDGNRTEGYVLFYDGWCDYDDPDCYDTFTWTKALTVDDICGNYTISIKGLEMVSDFTNWYDFDYTYTAPVTKVDDTTVELTGLYWDGYPLRGTFDASARTITFAPQQWGYYTFCLNTAGDDWEIAAGTEQPVTATIAEDMTITLNDWTAVYYGFPYFADTRATLVPAIDAARLRHRR